MKDNEQSWVLTGRKVGGIWVGQCRWESEGQPAEVTFPWQKVLARQASKGDVIGWVHTHPHMSATPSGTDIATMRAWVMSFGRPLLCIIIGNEGMRGYLYPDDDSRGIELEQMHDLGRGIVIGIEHGRPSSSRNRVSRQARNQTACSI